jgi:monoamine oxidase
MSERGRRRVRVIDSQAQPWGAFNRIFQSRADALEQAGSEWISSIAATIAAESIHDVLEAAGAAASVRAHATGLRNFWVADPDELSALVAAAQVVEGDPSKGAMYHIVGGNDQLVDALARESRIVIRRRHVVRAVEWTADRASAAIEAPSGRIAHATADYVVLALPVALLRDVKFTPALPALQQEAIRTLPTGAATKAILRYDTAAWRRSGKPRAYGSNLAVGAVWDTGEAQKGAALLSLLAGGRASAGLQRLLAAGDPTALSNQLRWFGVPRQVPRIHAVTWENDPWARGAYAYFSPQFDPALRPLLARAAGRVFFAGCHTSRNFQGYMNGAVESGIRVYEEIASAHAIR